MLVIRINQNINMLYDLYVQKGKIPIKTHMQIEQNNNLKKKEKKTKQNDVRKCAGA